MKEKFFPKGKKEDEEDTTVDEDDDSWLDIGPSGIISFTPAVILDAEKPGSAVSLTSECLAAHLADDKPKSEAPGRKSAAANMSTADVVNQNDNDFSIVF